MSRTRVGLLCPMLNQIFSLCNICQLPQSHLLRRIICKKLRDTYATWFIGLCCRISPLYDSIDALIRRSWPCLSRGDNWGMRQRFRDRAMLAVRHRYGPREAGPWFSSGYMRVLKKDCLIRIDIYSFVSKTQTAMWSRAVSKYCVSLRSHSIPLKNCSLQGNDDVQLLSIVICFWKRPRVVSFGDTVHLFEAITILLNKYAAG